MNLLIPLAAMLGLEVDSITERVRNAVMINTVMAVFGLIGFVFALVALYLALSRSVGSIYAATILAAVFLVLAFAIWLGGRMAQARHHRAQAEKRRSSETSAFVTTAALTAFPTIMKTPGLRIWGIPAAAAAAYFLMRGKNRPDL